MSQTLHLTGDTQRIYEFLRDHLTLVPVEECSNCAVWMELQLVLCAGTDHEVVLSRVSVSDLLRYPTD